MLVVEVRRRDRLEPRGTKTSRSRREEREVAGDDRSSSVHAPVREDSSRCPHRDEELRAVGARSSVGHREEERLVVLEVEAARLAVSAPPQAFLNKKHTHFSSSNFSP